MLRLCLNWPCVSSRFLLDFLYYELCRMDVKELHLGTSYVL